MATTPQQVTDFLRELAQRARPFAERDLTEIARVRTNKTRPGRLVGLDVGYASEHLRQQRYAFSEQEVKKYFPRTR